MINCSRNVATTRFWIPHPTIIRIRINIAQVTRRIVNLISKNESKATEIPVIITNHIRNIKMMKISIHIKKSGFKSNGDIKTPRVQQERGARGIDRLNFTKVFNMSSRITQTPEEPRVIGRGMIDPKINVTIFRFQNIDPENIVVIQISEIMFRHKRMSSY